jgi:WD40 repeat protein
VAPCAGVFSPDGTHLLSYGGNNHMSLWKVAPGHSQDWLTEGKKGPGDATFAAFLPGGQNFVTWGKDRSVRTWETSSGKQLSQFDLGDRVSDAGPNARNAAISPDGRRLLTSDEKGTVYLLELETGKEIKRFAAPALGLSFSPDGRYAASGSFRAGIWVWRLPD